MQQILTEQLPQVRVMWEAGGTNDCSSLLQRQTSSDEDFVSHDRREPFDRTWAKTVYTAIDIELSSRKTIKASPHLMHSTIIQWGPYVCWAPCPALSAIPGRDRQQRTNKYIHGSEWYREIIKWVKEDPKLIYHHCFGVATFQRLTE